MKQFLKILKFELKSYLKNKAFIGVTLFLVVAIAAATFLPSIVSAVTPDEPSQPENLPKMIVYAEDKSLERSAADYFANGFGGYDVVTTDLTPDEIKDGITSGEIECAFILNDALSYTYYVNDLSMWDSNVPVADELLKEVYRINAMLQGGLSVEETEKITSATVKSETIALGKDQMQNYFYTYIMIFALYMVILLYGQMVATNVASEKSSRAMELLITSAKPTSMMFGKVLASCIAGFTQLVVVFGSALLFYNINSEQLSNPIIASIFDMPVGLFLYLLLFFVLGFLIYAFLYGAIGSTASKLEDVNTSVLPITFLFIVAFLIVMFSMIAGNANSTLMKVCSYVPFTSPMAMFTRICMSSVAWYEILISVAILVASTFGIGVLSAKIYRVGVLLYDTKFKLKNIFKRK